MNMLETAEHVARIATVKFVKNFCLEDTEVN